MDLRAKRQPCQICGTVTQSIGYKAFVCGACSIFYRRNFRNKDRIFCRKNGNCDLQVGNRNGCRGCRMKMCRSLGLRMVGNSLVIQCNGYPKDDIEDDSHLSIVKAGDDLPTTSTAHTGIYEDGKAYEEPETSHRMFSHLSNSSTYSPPSVNSSTDLNTAPNSVQPTFNLGSGLQMFTAMENELIDDFFVDAVVGLKPACDPQYSSSAVGIDPNVSPILAKAVQVFQRFEDRQCCLSSICKGSEVKMDSDYVYINMPLYSIMENRTLRLVCRVITELMANIPRFGVPERAQILKSTLLEISSTYKLCLTSRFFPEFTDKHMAIFPGFYCRTDEFVGFMKKDYNRTKHVLKPLWEVGSTVINRFRYVKPNFTEMSMLSAALVWENIERLNLINDEAANARDTLYLEFHRHLVKTHGEAHGPIRNARLMSLMYDIKSYCATYEESFSLMGVFLPVDRDCFWMSKPQISDSQLMNLATEDDEADELGYNANANTVNS
ncbi:unnamed protein product [Bursaphelenchus okinawaensis]|uniref:Nuclear receptor domain-containing protein n=1 Tax=Bursaphelenchus okinawaensis TaxID=465554 RepID=A0A811KYK8_9BILA|nr:unnamed protein product [Bursaphelenchus okinawaensis]CAG9113833.1 unnamed protein product [Bursaphelenchus okinawaensis]